MTTQMTQFNFAPGTVPAAFHSLMQQMQGSELSENVGANFAVVSIKGKVFRIKYQGSEEQQTITYNGQVFAAPYMDVVIPMANPQLSKTWYPSGYTEGSDDAPSCWSEDGINPLAPPETRPVNPATGGPMTDCRTCPMNMFGSAINETTGAKGKACSDTRKVIIVPMRTVGTDAQGQPITEVDTDNAKYGGPMLLRVPAASLKVFAEYDRKLQAMGVPYFAVVTRLQFDQSVAYPKFSLSPVRMVTEAEGARIVELRDGPQVKAILSQGHDASPPPAAVQTAAPVQPAVPTAVPQAAPTPAPAVPVQQAAPVVQQAPPVQEAPPAFVPPAVQQAAPVQAAPVQAAPPAPVPQAAPAAAFPGFDAPPAPAVQAAPSPVAAALNPGVAAAGAAPAHAVSGELLSRIDQLLDS